MASVTCTENGRFGSPISRPSPRGQKSFSPLDCPFPLLYTTSFILSISPLPTLGGITPVISTNFSHEGQALKSADAFAPPVSPPLNSQSGNLMLSPLNPIPLDSTRTCLKLLLIILSLLSSSHIHFVVVSHPSTSEEPPHRAVHTIIFFSASTITLAQYGAALAGSLQRLDAPRAGLQFVSAKTLHRRCRREQSHGQPIAKSASRRWRKPMFRRQ